MAVLSEREIEILMSMEGHEWLRPLDVGGFNGSHHSATLALLVRRDLVESRQRRAHMSRGSKVYRIKSSGTEALHAQRLR